MSDKYYQDKLYPFQDDILRLFEDIDTDFYLTGGTALSRCYLKHRYYDDVDFFTNFNPNFKSQCSMLVEQLKKTGLVLEKGTVADTFLRIMVRKDDIALKVDFVNDVKYHCGEIEQCHIFYQVDNWKNILSNKMCALSRIESKDIADIIFIARTYNFFWEEIIDAAKEKDLWADPLEICRVIKQFHLKSLSYVKWIDPVDIDELIRDIHVMHDDIFWGRSNSLCT